MLDEPRDCTASRGYPMFEYVHHIAYVVSDMDNAVRVFCDTFELALSDRRVIEVHIVLRDGK